jgi:hypothetical protein
MRFFSELLYALSVPGYFILSIKWNPKTLAPSGTLEVSINSKAPFSNKLLISFCLDSLKDDGFLVS